MENSYEQMDDLGGNTPYFWFNTYLFLTLKKNTNG